MFSSRPRGLDKLDAAIKRGNLAEVQSLMAHEVDVGAIRKYHCGETPLHLAIIHRCPDILKVLINAKAEIMVRDSHNFTALQCALDRGELEMSRTLIEAGAEVNTTSILYGRTALHLAAEKNNIPAIEYLLFKKADVNHEDRIRWTPLHHAAYHNVGLSHYEAMRVLIENEASVEFQDDRGQSPLHLVLRHENVNSKLVKLLMGIKGAERESDA